MANEIIEQQLSDNTRTTANGAIVSVTTGRIIGLDRERRAEWAEARRRKAEAAAQDGLKAGLGAPDKFTAWARIVQAQAELAADPSAKAASTNAARFIGEVTGLTGAPQAAHAGPSQFVANVLAVDGGAILEKLLKIVDLP